MHLDSFHAARIDLDPTLDFRQFLSGCAVVVALDTVRVVFVHFVVAVIDIVFVDIDDHHGANFSGQSVERGYRSFFAFDADFVAIHVVSVVQSIGEVIQRVLVLELSHEDAFFVIGFLRAERTCQRDQLQVFTVFVQRVSRL